MAFLDSYATARRHLDDDLTIPTVRRPRRTVLYLTPAGWRWVAAPAGSRADRAERLRARAAYRRLGLTR